MAALTDAEILTKVKSGLGISGNYQDDTLQIYIDETRAFMIDSGVPSAKTYDNAAVGCILRGVIDLWDYGSGTGKFSESFNMRVIQLAVVSKLEGTGDE